MAVFEEPTGASLLLHVLKGPDKGQSQSFSISSEDAAVTIGFSSDNDFPLQDDNIEPFHGVFKLKPGGGGFEYTDLGDGKGSSVVSGDRLYKLRKGKTRSVEIRERAQILIGGTVVEVRLLLSAAESTSPDAERRHTTPPKGRSVESSGDDDFTLRDHIVRRVSETPDRLAQRISSSSDRLQVLFRLTSQLNGLNRFDDILERVAEAAFEMFPLASFFAIVVPDERSDSKALVPLFKKQRNSGGPAEPILSHSIVEQVVEGKESILYVRDKVSDGSASKSIVQAEITACLAAPLVAQRSLMGVMQVDSRGHSGLFTYDDLDLFVVLASSVAFAMERAKLSRNIYEMFEAFVEASVAAIEARDPTTAGHSERVAYYSLMTAEGVNRQISGALGSVSFSPKELTELRYAALLHDFGKIGVAEQVLQKPSRLMPDVEQVILQRIEAQRHRVFQNMQMTTMERLINEGRAPSAEDVRQLDAALKASEATLTRYRDTILKLQAPHSWPDPDDFRVIDEMEKLTFITSYGREERLLYADEAKDLRIQRGTLNNLERLHIQSHAQLTEEYLQRIPWSEDLRQIPCIAGRHHEKLDGSGYPAGLGAEDILPQVRILTIADIFDALTAADRPYRKAQAAHGASSILAEEAQAGKLDEHLVTFFNDQVVPSIKPMLLRGGGKS